MNKSGLSPVIATLLLIILVFVLATIIFMWARGFVAEQIEKKGEPIENICNQIYFDANYISGGEIEIINSGNIPIHHFEIKEFNSRGNEVFNAFSDLRVDAGKSELYSINLEQNTNKITIYPAIAGNVQGKSITKTYTCLDNGLTLDIFN